MSSLRTVAIAFDQDVVIPVLSELAELLVGKYVTVRLTNTSSSNAQIISMLMKPSMSKKCITHVMTTMSVQLDKLSKDELPIGKKIASNIKYLSKADVVTHCVNERVVTGVGIPDIANALLVSSLTEYAGDRPVDKRDSLYSSRSCIRTAVLHDVPIFSLESTEGFNDFKEYFNL